MLKKMISCAAALVTAASIAAVSAGAESMKGDVDGSGKIDIEDVVRVIQHINGIKSLKDHEKLTADIDHNDKVDIEDAAILINYINGASASIDKGERFYVDHFSLFCPFDWNGWAEGNKASMGYNGGKDSNERFAFVAIECYAFSNYSFPDLAAFANDHTNNYVNNPYTDDVTIDVLDISQEDINGYEAWTYGIHQYHYVSGHYFRDYMGKLCYMKNGDNVLVIQVFYPTVSADKMEKETNKILDSIIINDK